MTPFELFPYILLSFLVLEIGRIGGESQYATTNKGAIEFLLVGVLNQLHTFKVLLRQSIPDVVLLCQYCRS